ncbi:5'-deoxynucleotidase [Gorillibacterium massiliense]|uniref:5'-deoxynucleotidase n=1 Tax=Gorillibacterium massiliense TaxID=1280390 RepID=UPI0004B27A4B|nr:5'-deoxynucleotidase [Gorillibacterium massiliense]
MDHSFFAYMYRLRYIRRWSLMRNVVEENVAEHSFHVAILTHLLCTVGNVVYGKQLSADKAVTMALFHDATEVIVGDIPTPVKHQNPDILSNFREIERLAGERLLDMVPVELQPVYASLVESKNASLPTDADESERELRKIIKGADLLDAYLKCVTELAAGNREFAIAKGQIEKSLMALHLPEIEYFLEHLAPSFAQSLDELAEDH